MEELEKENKEEVQIPFEPDKKGGKVKMALAIVLGVLILINVVLLILYFVLGKEQDPSNSNMESASRESPTETAAGTEESSTAPETTAESSESVPETLPSSQPETTGGSSGSTGNHGTTGNISEEFGVVFDLVEEYQITAKIYVNLRSYPGVRDDGDIVGTLNHGEWATCVAVGRNGWYKLEYNGVTAYAVGSYLTTDASWTQGEGVVNTDTEEYGVIFHAVSDQRTAKEETNLRTQPTTDSEVVYTLPKGEYVERTGYSDTGWSKLVWNGQTVYAVTNYLE